MKVRICRLAPSPSQALPEAFACGAMSGAVADAAANFSGAAAPCLEIEAAPGENLARALWLSGGLPARALCAGLGRCGRCRVRFTTEAPAPLPAEEAFFLPEDLAAGFRLACRRQVPDKAGAQNLVTVELPADAFMPAAVSGRTTMPRRAAAGIAAAAPAAAADDVVLAVDLGTTSIHWRAVFTAGEARGRTAAEGRFLNPQAGAGADVMSRLAFARTCSGKRVAAQVVRQALGAVAADLQRAGLRLTGGCVAGNTAMTDIFLERDISGLCAAPYRASASGHEVVQLSFAEPFQSSVKSGADTAASAWPAVYIPPLPAPFVGGDISAGLVVLTARNIPRPFAAADLGTNGELALLTAEDELFLTSVPLGPALEGIGPECGQQAGPDVVSAFQLGPTGLTALLPQAMSSAVGSATGSAADSAFGSVGASIGAAFNVPLQAEGACVRGISATGYLSLLTILLSLGVLKADGRFVTAEECSSLMPLARRIAAGLESRPGGMRLRLPHGLWLAAADVEELLKVKAAFALALQALLNAADVRPADMAALCLAGTLGEYVRPGDLEALGFVPAGLGARVCAVGNTSLEGAVLLTLEPERREPLARLCARAQILSLPDDPDFQNNYLRLMRFGA